jgi:DNA sulfur modification protein DndD
MGPPEVRVVISSRWRSRSACLVASSGVSNASHQVVIFSTDTEVDRQNYVALQPHIARAYHLNYDEERRRTVGEEGYFWKE